MNISEIREDENWLALLELYGYSKDDVFGAQKDREITKTLNMAVALLLDEGASEWDEDRFPSNVNRAYEEWKLDKNRYDHPINKSLYDHWNNLKKDFICKLDNIGQCVAQEGGGEGSGEEVFGVFKMGDNYYRCNWTYFSHHGYGGAWEYNELFDELYKVKPKEVTITVYV